MKRLDLFYCWKICRVRNGIIPELHTITLIGDRVASHITEPIDDGIAQHVGQHTVYLLLTVYLLIAIQISTLYFVTFDSLYTQI
ncbi:hypothetical protein CEXT_587011 [Caerostris extrusa]|uniref:Uncharacterized protein n=1 Tax=Caerostris extrusa TaxID=172846 RepID=A0AAV4X2S8_CAEEX|nr:hypothetical protein CEXT_587011 [Caerostris extrusa]